MALRFIFACMAVVALCLAALAMMPVFDGIESERDAIIAAQQADSYEIAVPPQIAEDTDMQFASENDISTIEPAAGDMAQEEGFGSYFDGNSPSALSDPAMPQEAGPDEAESSQ